MQHCWTPSWMLNPPRASRPTFSGRVNQGRAAQPERQGMGLDLRQALGALFAASASALCLCACATEDAPATEDVPSLSEMKEFRAYPVYYSGNSVAGSSLVEVFGDPEIHEDKRDTTWVLIYGDCEADEGGCFPPLQIHSYSICARGAGLREDRLFDLRGAKATKTMRGSGAGLEIFTGRTTVTIGAENQSVLNSAVQALRNVREKHPPSSLPPPAPQCPPR